MHPYCITNVLSLIATLITLTLSASLPLDAAHSAVAFEKYQMQPATFKGEIGDHSYELNGTAEVQSIVYLLLSSLLLMMK
jgi:polyisoprenoid-binding protein YceI